MRVCRCHCPSGAWPGYWSCLAAGSQGTKGSAHSSGLERAQPGAVSALGSSLPAPLPWAPLGQEQQAGSSSQHCLALPHILVGAETPSSSSPVFGGFEGDLQLFSSAQRAFVKAVAPCSGVRGKPSPGAGGSRGRNPLAAWFLFSAHPGPFPTLSRD